MTEASKPSLESGNTENFLNPVWGFKKTGIFLFVMVLTGLISQNVYEWFEQGSYPDWLGTIGALTIMAVFLVGFFRPLSRNIHTPYFAILSLLFIAFGTALGTFITQNTPREIFVQRYGDTGSSLLQFLQLDDVFHSWWYVGFFIFLIASLIQISIKKGFSKETIGFQLAHLGPVVVLAGFWVDYFYGFRGIMPLEVGEDTQTVRVYQGNTNYVQDSMSLDFRVRLDTFEFEKYDPDYRIQIWKRDTAGQVQEMPHGGITEENRPKIIASLPLEMKNTHRIYSTNAYFQLADFFPNFEFEYTYPLLTDSIEAKDPGIMLKLQTSLGENVIQLRALPSGRNKIADPTIGSRLEFYWELPAGIFEESTGMVAGEEAHADWVNMDRIIFAGQDRMIYFLKDGSLTKEAIQANTFYPFPGKEEEGFSILHVFPDAAHLQAIPSSKNDELENPVARVTVWGGAMPEARDVYLYPARGRRGGTFVIPGTNYFLALQSFKDQETKFWKSSLSVLGAGGEVVKSRAVKVNSPMLYRGYRFYQSDYDPNNPNYSGIGVSHEPGLYILYFGFMVLVAGCFMLFYWR